jgi:hypothetical protein
MRTVYRLKRIRHLGTQRWILSITPQEWWGTDYPFLHQAVTGLVTAGRPHLLASGCYRRSTRPPEVRAQSRQRNSHDTTRVAERLATYATAGALHLWKCQQFWFEHSQVPLARERAAAFISSLITGRAVRRRSRPSRAFARRSSKGGSTPSGSDELLILPILSIR